jgi:hypothetical protein
MRLEAKIEDRIVAYYLRGEVSIAFELGVLHLELAERRISRDRVNEACLESIRWFQQAGVKFPDNFSQLICWQQRKELRRLIILIEEQKGELDPT